MPQPNVKALLVSGPLANVSIAYRNANYIADRVFPIIDNVDPRAKITRYGKDAWFRDEAGIRAPGARAPRGGYGIGYIPLNTVEYAFAKEVTEEDRRFAKSQNAPPLQPDQDAIEFATDKVDLKKERRVAELIFKTKWADGNTGGEDAEGKWAPGDGNTFLADIEKGIKTIQSQTGITPNRLILDFGTYSALKQEPTILEKIKYTERAVLTSAILASLLDLEEVLVGKAIVNVAKENKSGRFEPKYIWEKTPGKGMGFLFYAPPKPGLKIPSAGYQARVAYENNLPRRTMVWHEPAEHQDVYEVAEETDIVVTGADLGYLWVNTLNA